MFPVACDCSFLKSRLPETRSPDPLRTLRFTQTPQPRPPAHSLIHPDYTDPFRDDMTLSSRLVLNLFTLVGFFQVGITGDLFGWGVNCSCPDGSLPKVCDPSPCSALKCPAFPEAYCLVDTCYGCNAIFMVNGMEVDCRVQTKFPGANVTVAAVVNAEVLPTSSSVVTFPTSGKAVSSQSEFF
jgi:hypothetical protein